MGPQGRSGHVRKISPPPGFDPWTIQPVASRYTDYAVYSGVVTCLLPIARNMYWYFELLNGTTDSFIFSFPFLIVWLYCLRS